MGWGGGGGFLCFVLVSWLVGFVMFGIFWFFVCLFFASVFCLEDLVVFGLGLVFCCCFFCLFLEGGEGG